MILDSEGRARLRARLAETGGIPSLSEMPPVLASLYGTIDEDRFPGGIVPRLEDGRWSFYAVAESAEAWRRLQPLILAFGGITLSTFDGRATELNRADAFEVALLEHGISHAARFGPPPDKDLSRALVRSLVRLRDGVQRAPSLTDDVPRTTAQLLGDFRLALASVNEKVAQECIATLRSEMRLDALNLHFLEVQLDASLGDWERLRQRGFFAALCLTRRPPRVTAALTEAVYHHAIAPLAADADPAAILAHFKVEVAGRYGELLTTCPPAPSPAVATMFLLSLLTTPDRAQAPKLEWLWGEAGHWREEDLGGFRQLIEFGRGLLAQPAKEPIATSTVDARSQIEHLRAKSAGLSAADARAGLVSASLLQTLEAYNVAIEAIGQLPQDEREALLEPPGIRAMWHEIRAHAYADHVPVGWEDLIRRSPQLPFAVLRNWAEKGATEFPIERALTDRESVESILLALQRAFVEAEDTVHELLPYLVEWAHADARWPNPDYAALYSELLDLLLLGKSRTPSVVRAVADILAALLAVGVEPERYVAVSNDLSEWLPSATAIRTVDSLIDIGDLFATYPCPDPDARRSYWSVLGTELARLWPKLSAGQQIVVKELASVLGALDWLAGATIQAPIGGDRLARPAPGYVIAIYTLLESAGSRVKRALATLYPGVRVELSTDHVATARLTELATRADLFVVCWAAATHAATDVIRQRRPSARATLYPRGVGSSSVIQEIQDYVASAFSP